jgi:hypothetical protein
MSLDFALPGGLVINDFDRGMLVKLWVSKFLGV